MFGDLALEGCVSAHTLEVRSALGPARCDGGQPGRPLASGWHVWKCRWLPRRDTVMPENDLEAQRNFVCWGTFYYFLKTIAIALWEEIILTSFSPY